MPPTTVNELLKDAKQVIATEDRWTQGRLEDASGCHCALGAAFVAAGIRCLDDDGVQRPYEIDPTDDGKTLLKVALALSASSRYGGSDEGDTGPIWRTNDRDGFDAVHEMYDRAIEATS